MSRCLEKKREGRYTSADELRSDLVTLKAQRERAAGVRTSLANRWVVAALVVAFVVLAAGASWYYVRTSRERWVTQTAIPEIQRLANQEDYTQAFRMVREAERYLPTHPDLARELASRVESADDSGQYWRLERVGYTSAYGNDRVPAFVLLPRNATPPFQAVIYFPGADAFMLTSSRHAALQQAYVTDFIVRSGRALVFPVYYNAYERRAGPSPAGSAAERDRLIRQAQDVSRTVDYLQTRPDIDRARIAYYGFSAGATPGPIFMALEPRLTTGILLSGGLIITRRLPEVDQLNFVPRVKQPTLVISGRDDFAVPLDRAQRMLTLLGTSPEHKRHAVVDGGHFVARQDLIREILPWLDKYLGPVTQR